MASAAVSHPREPTHVYQPRQPEQSVLRRAVREHLDAFLERCAEAERPVPQFVEKELRAFVDCGRPERGAVRVRCASCGFDRLVPFSCRGRGGICGSCASRRMAETAANLVDSVLPRAPYRQYVLTVPVPLRYLMAYRTEVCSDVIGVFMQAVAQSMRHRAKRELGLARVGDAHTGGICFVQRFGSSGANLHPHLHALFVDGVFVEQEGGVTFHALPQPSIGELNAIAWSVCERVTARLRRRGLWLDAEPGNDPLAAAQPLLASLAGASLSGTLLFGASGQRPLRMFATVSGGTAEACNPSAQKSNNGFGFNLDASVRVPEDDRQRLERLARYMGRPSIAEDRVERREDGRYCLWFKRPWSNGTTAVVVSGIELVARLAALVPPPRMHLTRYFGVFASRAQLRAQVVPSPPPPVAAVAAGCEHAGAPVGARSSDAGDVANASAAAQSRRRRMKWSQLLRRVYEIDVSICPRCGQKGMQQIAIITRPDVIRRMLESLERAQGP
jgi:hypothetical protein